MGVVDNCIADGDGLGLCNYLGSLGTSLRSCVGASLGAGLGGVETL
jgi:hypothetical protein